MARRTYLVEMYFLAYRMYRYLTRYRDKYYPDLDLDHKAAIDNMLDQLQAFILLFPAPEQIPNSP